MTVAERLAPMARTISDAQVSRKLRRDLPAIGSDAADAVGQLVDSISGAVEDLAEGAERAGDEAKKETRHATRDIGEAVSDAFDAVTAVAGDAAAKAGDVAAKAGDAARDLHLENRVEDVIKRIRQDFPTERITGLVASLERELPTTDKDRYDRAYRRGWTRARTSFVGVGLAAGVAAGIAGAFLLDPQRGPQRRASLKATVRRMGTTVSREARGRATWVVDRARGIAIERGLIEPAGDAPDRPADALGTTTPQPLVPVMGSAAADTLPMHVDGSTNGDAHSGGPTQEELAQLADDGAPVPANPAS